MFILDALAKYAPSAKEAESIAERVAARLQHANSAVVMSAVKVGGGGRWKFAFIENFFLMCGSPESNFRHGVEDPLPLSVQLWKIEIS